MQMKLTEEGVKEGSKKGVKESPISINVPLNTSIKDNINWHRSHRYLFVFSYEGPQPTRGSNSFARVGRYKTIPQARFNYNEDKAIIFTLPHTLKVWIKHPEGIKTQDQFNLALKTAWETMNSFSRKHGINILGVSYKHFSEHTIESKPLDKLARELVSKEPKLAKDELGLSINETSHKGKVEWTGPKAKERVMVLEHMLDEGLDKLATKDDISRLTKAVSDIASILERVILPEGKRFLQGGLNTEDSETEQKPPPLNNSSDYR